MEKTWIEPSTIDIPSDLTTALNDHPLLAETLTRRGITDAEQMRRFLDPTFYKPASPYDMPDMAKAVERVARAITHHEKLLIWGDFDVDGQTATSLLVSALRKLELNVNYYIPHRLKEGHGVHIASLRDHIDHGAQVIITCDTGIAAHDAINYAQGRGVDVIITDHHQLPEKLPDAYAAVNPQRLAPDHPARTLPGVGCAHQFIMALYEHLGREDNLDYLLDLVALGIVADVAVQTGDTRYWLQRGLDVLRTTERLGLQEIYKLASVTPNTVDEETIGYTLGPRLNALGRLDDANVAVELLTTNNVERARILANRLEGLNAERKLLSDQVYQAAEAQLENDPRLLNYAALVLAHERWPGGVIGIVANRLVEKYSRPAILLNMSEDGIAHGSARSVAGCDITAALMKNADLLLTYGGHTMAAGMSLHTERIADLRHQLSRTVAEMLIDVPATASLKIDAFLPLADLSLDLVHSLRRLAPFGPGNPPLKLATRKLTLKDQRQLGRTGKHQRLTVVDEAGTAREVVWWRADLDLLPPGRFDLAYELSENHYKGQTELQITLVDVRPVDEAPLAFAQRAHVEVLDYRNWGEAEQRKLLATFATDEAVIWAEGDVSDVDGLRRDQLHPAKILVIWSVPAGETDLQTALKVVNPDQVVLFARDTGTDSVQLFLQRLGGVVKHLINAKDGQTTIDALCGAMSHTAEAIRLGLQWMAARGHITLIHDDGTNIHVVQDGNEHRDDFTTTTTNLTQRLQEAAAYRGYFQRADTDSLFKIENPKLKGVGR